MRASTVANQVDTYCDIGNLKTLSCNPQGLLALEAVREHSDVSNTNVHAHSNQFPGLASEPIGLREGNFAPSTHALGLTNSWTFENEAGQALNAVRSSSNVRGAPHEDIDLIPFRYHGWDDGHGRQGSSTSTEISHGRMDSNTGTHWVRASFLVT